MDPINTNIEMRQQLKSCNVLARQEANVSIPVAVKPKVSAGNANAYCCGEAKITPSSCCTKCKNYTTGTECCFVLTQHICIEIPFEISADVQIAAASVDCCITPCPDRSS